MQHKTLIIGWDGATYDLLKPWAAAGYLPTVARLMEQGAHGVLHAYPNMNSASAWSSIVTGCNPGKHGIFEFGDSFETSVLGWHPVTALDRQRDPFWRILTRAGQSVDVVNVPISYPADPINGFMISGMDSPNIESPNATHPGGLIKTLRSAGIEYILDVPGLKKIRERVTDRLPAEVQDMVQARTRTILHFMDQHPWDVLMAVYIATDRMQHSYWAPTDDPADPRWIPVRETYALLDAHLNKLIERAGEDTTVLLLSDHGFGRGHGTRHDLNPLFARLGWLKYRQSNATLQGRMLQNVLNYGRRYLPQRFQLALATRFPQWRQRAVKEQKFGRIDWANTKVFQSSLANVVVNLKGRESHGIVPPEEYNSLCEAARTVIAQVTDAASGHPLTKSVLRRNELYRGPFVERVSDLIIEWDRQFEPHGLRWQGDGELFVAPSLPGQQNAWRGNHRSEGIFIAHGPNVQRGAQIDRVLQYDIAPTVLYLQGVGLPGDWDGRVLTELFDPAYLQAHPVATAEAGASAAPAANAELSAQDAALVEQRLRDLGYME